MKDKKPQSYSEACDKFRKALINFCDEVVKTLYIPQITKWIDKILSKKEGK